MEEQEMEVVSEETSVTGVNEVPSEPVTSPDTDTSGLKVIEPLSEFHIVKVENLLKKKFLECSYEEQLKIKQLGPYKPKDVKISQVNGTDYRHFSHKWFDRVEWLTVNESNKKFYCFYCLLYNGDSVWSTVGFSNIRNLSEKTKIHDSSKAHLINAFKFKCFGNESLSQSSLKVEDVSKHNEMVDKNRHILSRLFDCVKFCVAHGIEPSEENSGIFCNLAQEIANFDPILREGLKNSTPFDFKCQQIQNKLLQSIHTVYQEEIKSDIEKAEFVSLIIEKVEGKPDIDQFALILRYLKDGLPTERLYCFVSCKNKKVEELVFNIRKELNSLNLACKLIAQCYDGFISVRSPYAGIQSELKKLYPHALFVHSYMHSFEKIIRQTCSYIPCIRDFFNNISKFSQFFHPSSKEYEALNIEYIKNPSEVVDLQMSTDSAIIKVLYHNEKEVCATLKKISAEAGAWSDRSVYEANQLEVILKEQSFIFLLRLFFTIFIYIEVLVTTFKERTTYGEVMSAVKCFETAIGNLMDVIKKAPESQHKTASIDACCIIITEIRERIEGSDHLVTFLILNPYKYKMFTRFPQDHVKVLECKYRMLVPVKLGNELRVLYKSESSFLIKNECSLLKIFKCTGLVDTFSEVCKLIEIILVTPTSPIEGKSKNVAERLEEFVKGNWKVDRLLVYAELALHFDVIDNNYNNFRNRVIEHFANQDLNEKNFLFKSHSYLSY